MFRQISQLLIAIIYWSQKYIKTDMMYAVGGSFWILVGKAGILGVSVATMAAFSRWLPKEAYGTYQFLIAALGIAGIFALSGMSTSLIKSVAQNKEGTLWLVIKEKMRWSLLGSLGLLLFSAWYLIQQNTLLAIGFLLLALFLPLNETSILAPVFWIGKKRFDLQSGYNFIPSALSLFVVLPVIYLTDNILWILFFVLVSRVAFHGIFLLKTLKKITNHEKDQSAISFGKHLTTMDVVIRLSSHIDKIILWQFLGPVQLAIYTFAQFPIKSLGGSIPLHNLALPKLSEKNIKDIKRGLLNKFYLLFFLSIPAALIVALSAPFGYRIFFPQYIESVIYFQALSMIIILIPFDLLGAALISDVRQKELYIIRVAPSFVRIALFFVLVPFYQIWGIIGAFLVAEVIRRGIIFYYFQKIY